MNKPLTSLLLACLAILPLTALAGRFQVFQTNSRQVIEQSHANKPMILTFWSVDCAYCMDDLRALGEIVRQHPDIAFVTVNTDQDNASAAEKLLDQLELPAHERWQFAQGDVDRLRYHIDSSWYGELPRTYFYNRRNEVQTLSGKPEAAWLKRWAATR